MENERIKQLKKSIQKEEIFLSDYREQLIKVNKAIENSITTLKRLNISLIEVQRSFQDE